MADWRHVSSLLAFGLTASARSAQAQPEVVYTPMVRNYPPAPPGAAQASPPRAEHPEPAHQPPEESEWDREEAERYARRIEGRMRVKVSIDLDFTIGSARQGDRQAGLVFVSPLLGLRHHLHPRFGLHWRAGGIRGSANYHDPYSGYFDSPRIDSTSLTGGFLEVIPFFGPFGRFYIGPLVWGGYLAYGKLRLQSDQSSFTLTDGWAAGTGIHGGVLLGQMEWLAIHFSLVGIASSGLTVLATVGIGAQGAMPVHLSSDEPR